MDEAVPRRAQAHQAVQEGDSQLRRSQLLTGCRKPTFTQVAFCIVDLETTGGAETDVITEIGAVKVRGGEVLGEFQTLVNPKAHIPPLIAVLTGITNQMVANAPSLR